MAGTQSGVTVHRGAVGAGRGRRRLAWGAVLGPVQFTLAWLVLGVVSTGYTLWDMHITPYSPISQPISGLGLGSTAAYMNTAFVALGILLITGVAGIVAGLPELSRRARRTCAALLALPGVGAVMDGLFDLESILMHTAGFGLVLTSVVGFPVVGWLLNRVPRWRAWGRALVLAGPVTLVLAVIYFANFDPVAAGENLGVGGLAQRILVTEILLWYAILGWLIAAGSRGRAGRSV
jgi:hypothetical protein